MDSIPNLTQVEKYYYPKTIQEALDYLNQENKPKLIAGGTNVVVSDDKKTKTLIDLQNLPLNFIDEKEDTIEVGATTTITKLQQCDKFSKYSQNIISKACTELATIQIRNISTVGGNIARSYPWALLPVIMLALDATVVIVSTKGERKISSQEFFANNQRIASNEIITKVIFPKSNKLTTFKKYSRTKSDYCLIISSISANRNNKSLNDVRIAVGSVVNQPQRLLSLEKKIEAEANLTAEKIETLVAEAVNSLTISKSVILSQEWRQEYLRVHLKRMLIELVGEN